MDTTKQYFLIKTRLEPIKGEDNIYLGDWAVRNREKIQITVPFLWDSPEKMEKAYLYCQKVYEEILPIVSERLNNIHPIQLSEKQYHLILGNWLVLYIHQLYDKYSHLKYAYEHYDIVDTSIVESNYIPTEYLDFIQRISSDDLYNLEQYSQIIRYLNYPYSILETEAIEQKQKYTTLPNKVKILKKTIFNIVNICPYKKVTITSPYFRYKIFTKYLKLFLRNPCFFRFDDFDNYYIEANTSIDLNIRSKIKFEKSNDEFINILLSLIPNNIPSLFVEGFIEFWREVEKLNLSKTAIYYTANALHRNYIYKFFLAQNIDKVKIYSHQHGGGYGLLKFVEVEEYEKTVSNKFLTWGWKDDKSRYLSPPRLDFDIKYDDTSSKILLVSGTLSRFVFKFFTQYISSLYSIYEKHLFYLLQNSKYTITIRDYYNQYGRDTLEQIQKRFLNTKIENPNSIDFRQSLKDTKLVLILHLATTYLETLANNIPTLILLDMNIYSFKEESKKYFQKLVDAKIAFYNIEDFVKHLNQIADNPQIWWNSSEVQQARKEFVSQYARTSKDWAEEWIDFFTKELNDPS